MDSQEDFQQYLVVSWLIQVLKFDLRVQLALLAVVAFHSPKSRGLQDWLELKGTRWILEIGRIRMNTLRNDVLETYGDLAGN